MSFKHSLFTLVLGVQPLICASAADNPSDDNTLLSTPNTCVALRQGRTCYSDITFNWQVNSEDRYCIRRANNSKPLHCWERTLRGEISIDFASATAQSYELFHVTTQQVLARSEVKVQWVYTSKQRKRRWRLF
ncbi:DUF3019 domain-containing protein [Pseudoalteromonas pernae]|uniref:DUF3019 domain-containing protein n=1 Tax=Pseudoalteromonas pernae TaxID=3118054 RepID=UPI0032429194